MAPRLLVAPSILAADFGRLAEEIADVERGGADMLHLDIMDGHFVDNITFGPPLVASIRRASRLPLDCHLMITDPDRYIPAFARAGADLISFHIEVRPDPRATIRRIREAGVRPAIAVNPSTPLHDVIPHLGDLDLVLIMSVHPGFGGQPFDSSVLGKIRELRERHGYRGHVEIDGGIAPATAPLAVEAGVDVLVAGTAIFRAPDRSAAIRALRDFAGGAGAPVPD